MDLNRTHPVSAASGRDPSQGGLYDAARRDSSLYSQGKGLMNEYPEKENTA